MVCEDICSVIKFIFALFYVILSINRTVIPKVRWYKDIRGGEKYC